MKNNKINVYLIIIAAIIVIAVLSVGYALLNVDLNFNAQGIIQDNDLAKLSTLILNNESIVTTGDGLYSQVDPINSNLTRYYFSGSNVNNNITFNNETWRIISIESDGSVRIIKDACLSSDLTTTNSINFWTTYSVTNYTLSTGDVIFDSMGRRPVDSTLSNSYCNATKKGCNAYGMSSYYSKSVDADSLVKLYLDTIYYVDLPSNARNQLTTFSIKSGLVSTVAADMEVSRLQAKEIAFLIDESNIGLANISDYVLSSTESACHTSYDSSTCSSSNWMTILNVDWFLLNGRDYTNPTKVFIQDTTGKLVYSKDATYNSSVRPVLHLKSNISATYENNSYVLGDIIQ